MSNIQMSEVLYRIVLNPEHSLCFQTAGECFERYQTELLAGRQGMKIEVLASKSWVGINDPQVCRWCRKPFGKEPHTQCQVEEDQAYHDFCDYRASVRMDLHG